MKVKVNKSKCIGCGDCEALCPKVFVLKNGKATVKESPTEEKCARKAAYACPVNAISIS